MALPRGVMGWSEVCDCGISQSLWLAQRYVVLFCHALAHIKIDQIFRLNGSQILFAVEAINIILTNLTVPPPTLSGTEFLKIQRLAINKPVDKNNFKSMIIR